MSTIPHFDPTPAVKADPVVTQRHFLACLLALLLGVVTMALYWPALGHPFVRYDDDLYVTENVHVRTGLTMANVIWAFLNPVTGNWHPLTMISHMADSQVFGMNPWGHHLTSVLLHALNTVLVFLWLRGLTGMVWRSALVAALFGWHPVNVECVAWIAERKSVLSLCFGLLTLIFYTRYARSDGGASHRAYGLTLGCFALGLMSKSILVTWPFVLLLLDYWPLGRWPAGRWWPLLREKIPFLALVAAVSVATILCHRAEGDLAALGSLPWGARVENALVSYVRYLGKLFWPVNLAAFYPHPGYWPVAEVLLAVVFLAGITWAFFGLRRRAPCLLTGWLWFLGTLVPVIGLLQVGAQSMADRHAYIPSLGILILTVWGVGEGIRRWRAIQMMTTGAALAACLLCLALTRHQLRYWQNDETLFQHALAVTSNNFIAHYNMGSALAAAGKTDEAIDQYREGLRIKPDDADLHSNLGFALIQKKRTDEAIQQYQEALRFKPDDARTHDNLGLALNSQGQTNAAIEQFQDAIRFQPDFVPAHYDLGVVLNELGQTDAAINQFQVALQFDPGDIKARYNLGNALAKAGESAGAMAQFGETLRLAPGNADAHNNLGNLLVRTGQNDQAINEFAAAARLKADNADFHYNLASALLRAGRLAEAVPEFKTAVRLKPDYAPAHYNLGIALGKTGETDAAVEQFKEAIRLQPDYAIAHNSLGVMLAAQGQLDAAINEFQTALRLKPDYLNAQNNLARALAGKHK
jgi:tetratricopeptide (TPR) repeat protein